LIELAREYMEP